MPSRPRATEPPAAPRLALSIQAGDGVDALPAPRAQLRRWAAAAIERDCALALRFVGEDEARALNRGDRGRDYATNVLTFEYGPPHGPGEPPQDRTRSTDRPAAVMQADIVICLPVVDREAHAQGKAARDHLAHLIVHGVLHAQGWDHERNAHEAARMEARERTILARFRIPDPYAES